MSRKHKLKLGSKFNFFSYVLLLAVLYSCGYQAPRSTYADLNSNDPSSLAIGYGRVLRDNPYILSNNNATLALNFNVGNFLNEEGDFITSEQFLMNDYFQVLKTPTSTPINSDSSGKWAFSPIANPSEFYQVHTFYHVAKSTDYFQTNLRNYYRTLQQQSLFQSSIPSDLYTYKANWHPTNDLYIYAITSDINTAYFEPSTYTIHMGIDSNKYRNPWVQDPSILYHETAHAFQQIMLNFRNVTSAISERSDLGYLGYDEAGAIGEGLSDFYSYAMNKRRHFGEWVLGRMHTMSRPLSEDDSIHAAGISLDSDSRLSYPNYLNYDPNTHTTNQESIHNSGMITSHYLTALTDLLIDKCSFSEETSVSYVLTMVIESLSELGDLSAKGFDGVASSVYNINLNSNHSLDWIRKINPVNYRSFYQKLAKYQYLLLNNNETSTLCSGTFLPQDTIETLLDNYGLLLFDNYNLDGNDAAQGHAGASSSVSLISNLEINPLNRLKTTLIKKTQLKLDPRTTSSSSAVTAYITDKRSNVQSAIQKMIASGQITSISSLIDSDLPYNNGNGEISPGEIVGVTLNLYNASNSTMGGVEILANDWDHFRSKKPCNTTGDNFPTVDAGGYDSSTETGTNPGECKYITRNNGGTSTSENALDDLYPVCFVQYNSSGSGSSWVAQSTFATNNGFPAKKCLSGTSTKTKDCFIRAIKGADYAYFSKIESGKSWAESYSTDTTTTEKKLNLSNVIFFEVNPWTPPGTTFNCRFRARFTNCEDCYTDSNTSNSDDFLDYEYSGGTPFRIISLSFEVTN